MNRTYIKDHSIVEQYLLGELSEQEAFEFEAFCMESNQTFSELLSAEKLIAGVKRLHSERGQLFGESVALVLSVVESFLRSSRPYGFRLVTGLHDHEEAVEQAKRLTRFLLQGYSIPSTEHDLIVERLPKLLAHEAKRMSNSAAEEALS